jgi:leucyl-tRNA synthetase
VQFPLTNGAPPVEVFTTRVETIFGVACLVLAPDHPLVPVLTAGSHKAAVDEYLSSWRERCTDSAERSNSPVSTIVQ